MWSPHAVSKHGAEFANALARDRRAIGNKGRFISQLYTEYVFKLCLCILKRLTARIFPNGLATTAWFLLPAKCVVRVAAREENCPG